MESLPREVGRGAGTITSKGYGMMQAFQIMRSIIDSLQEEQPEVELEKETERIPKPELTWEDIQTIDNIVVDMARNTNWPLRGQEVFYTEVLQRFAKLKEEKKK